MAREQTDTATAERGAPESRPRGGRALIRLAILAGCAALSILSLRTTAFQAAGLEYEVGGNFDLVLWALYACSAAGVGAVGFQLVGAGRGGRAAAGPGLWRFTFCATVAFLVLNAVHFQPYRPLNTLMAAGLAAGFLVLAIVMGGLLVTPSRARLLRPIDLLLTSLCVALVLGELGLRAFDAVHPTQILAGVDTIAGDRLAGKRLRPGALRFAFPANSRGDFDHEYNGREADSRLVVTIADSYSTGAVPFPLHFTSVAERELEDANVVVYNMGSPGVGPPEYLYMLTEEALAMRPDLVVICLFVGNDIVVADPTWRELAGRWALDRDHLYTTRLVTRLGRLSAERGRASAEGAGAGHVQGEHAAVDGIVDTTAKAMTEFPWTADVTLERPTFSITGFEQLEIGRARQVCLTEKGLERGLRKYMTTMTEAAGDTPIVFLLIPDEYQVEDAVWNMVRAPIAERMDRFQPQRVLELWGEELGLEIIDLLPEFLAVEPLEDGRRHLYHYRDSHWNTRGNRLGGEILAREVRRMLSL
ncbi:MAG: hypothetical protein CMJ84_12645 [Planctomycetes bacterium]|nr:hypothetical protein [Planctomycetota bacterium]MDP6410439.1 hypothetical protein [Planctomycetota bacterium]